MRSPIVDFQHIYSLTWISCRSLSSPWVLNTSLGESLIYSTLKSSDFPLLKNPLLIMIILVTRSMINMLCIVRMWSEFVSLKITIAPLNAAIYLPLWAIAFKIASAHVSRWVLNNYQDRLHNNFVFIRLSTMSLSLWVYDHLSSILYILK